MVNINDIARLTVYAKSTVSNVFTKKRPVSQEIVDRVLAVARELNYTPNYFASNIMGNKTNIVGLFLEAENQNYYPFYNTLIQSLVTSGAEFGKQILIYFDAKAESIPSLLRTGVSPLEGAVILSPSCLDRRVCQLETLNLPYVVIGSLTNETQPYCSVDMDNADMMHIVLEHLYQKGHRKILFANSNQALTVSRDRDKGVHDEVCLHPSLTVRTLYLPNESGSVDSYLAPAVAEGHTAVVCSSDIIANDVYKFALNCGLAVGKELSVIALGGNVYAGKLRPRLTRCEQNYLEIGRECIRILVGRMNDEHYTERKILYSSLKLGESVADLSVRT